VADLILAPIFLKPWQRQHFRKNRQMMKTGRSAGKFPQQDVGGAIKRRI
jgi:hypothetical protein